MSVFHLKIVTPDKVFFDGEAERVILRTSEGDIGILAHHEPYVATLPSGPVTIRVNGEDKLAALSTGVLKVSADVTTILAIAMEWADEIDVAWAKRSEESARERKAKAKSDSELNRAELKLQRALNRIQVSSMAQKK
ncbi:MAG: ATP synthase F1 subunit epsilon [Ruminococcus sp.]|nr:ATP synthase F1 subunit epsilon [Ruminococcus sp.]